MPKVTYNGIVLAESDSTEMVEGNHYFPPESLNPDYFAHSANHTTTVCSWKGRAQYYDVTIDGERVADAAWYYPEPKRAAENITGYVAFYKSKVTVED
jgi:uncharacterized protein (DUF427 family)